jgi:hypothetical protein
MIETALIIGTWCLVDSWSMGYDLIEHRAIARNYRYERKADCAPEDRLVIGRRGLDNRAYLSEDEDGTSLIIEGNVLVKKPHLR